MAYLSYFRTAQKIIIALPSIVDHEAVNFATTTEDKNKKYQTLRNFNFRGFESASESESEPI